MQFRKNEVRTFPTNEDFMADKKKSDLLYGFYLDHSYITEDKRRYCWKMKVTPKEILQYFRDKDEVFSERKIRDTVKLFIGAGLLVEGIRDGKKIYYITDLEPGEYVFIKVPTLRYLVDTATQNVIKVYAYLKKRWEQHIDFNFKDNYCFSKKELLEVIGYSVANAGKEGKIISHILDCLVNNELIQYRKITKQGVPYLELLAVNEDYKTLFVKSKEQGTIPIPFPHISN